MCSIGGSDYWNLDPILSLVEDENLLSGNVISSSSSIPIEPYPYIISDRLLPPLLESNIPIGPAWYDKDWIKPRAILRNNNNNVQVNEEASIGFTLDENIQGVGDSTYYLIEHYGRLVYKDGGSRLCLWSGV
jgi:hypothetical protein